MRGWPDLSTRSVELEAMDDPACPEAPLQQTVQQFASINRMLARYRSLLKRWVLEDMRPGGSTPYCLLDLGAGGCDIPVWLLAAARRRRQDLRVIAWDSDPRVVAYARRCRGATPGLTIVQADALSHPIPESVDYLFANHFLHHLPDAAIVSLLQRWVPRVRRRLVFSDLSRSRWSCIGFGLLTLGLWRNSFARADGLLSIRRGFRADELLGLAARAGLAGCSHVVRLYPGRLALVIDPV